MLPLNLNSKYQTLDLSPSFHPHPHLLPSREKEHKNVIARPRFLRSWQSLQYTLFYFSSSFGYRERLILESVFSSSSGAAKAA